MAISAIVGTSIASITSRLDSVPSSRLDELWLTGETGLLINTYAGSLFDSIASVNLTSMTTSVTAAVLGTARREISVFDGGTYACAAGGLTTGSVVTVQRVEWASLVVSSATPLNTIRSMAAAVTSPTGGVMTGGFAGSTTTLGQVWTSAGDTWALNASFNIPLSDRRCQGVRVSSAHGYVVSGELRTSVYDVVFAAGTTRISTTLAYAGLRGLGGVAKDGVATYFASGNTAGAPTLGLNSIVKVTDSGTISTLAATLPALRRMSVGFGDGTTQGMWVGGDHNNVYYATAFKINLADETTSLIVGADAPLTGWWSGGSSAGQ